MKLVDKTHQLTTHMHHIFTISSEICAQNTSTNNTHALFDYQTVHPVDKSTHTQILYIHVCIQASLIRNWFEMSTNRKVWALE